MPEDKKVSFEVVKGLKREGKSWLNTLGISAVIIASAFMGKESIPKEQKHEPAALEQRMNNPYGGLIKLEDTLRARVLYKIDTSEGVREVAKTNPDVAKLYKKSIQEVHDFISEKSQVLKPATEYSGYELPFRIALLAAANAPRVEGRYLEGDKDWKTREYTINPKGLASKDYAEEQTCTFVDAPMNNEVGEHLIFRGVYEINGKKRQIIGFYNMGDVPNPVIRFEQMPTLKSWVYFGDIDDPDMIYSINKDLAGNSKNITIGRTAVKILKEVMDSYKKNIEADLENKLRL